MIWEIETPSSKCNIHDNVRAMLGNNLDRERGQNQSTPSSIRHVKHADRSSVKVTDLDDPILTYILRSSRRRRSLVIYIAKILQPLNGTYI